jgi:hypothetical protein
LHLAGIEGLHEHHVRHHHKRGDSGPPCGGNPALPFLNRSNASWNKRHPLTRVALASFRERVVIAWPIVVIMAFPIDEAYLPAILTVGSMTDEAFAQLCSEHPDLNRQLSSTPRRDGCCRKVPVGVLREKMCEWLANGAQLGRPIDPEVRTVEICGPASRPKRWRANRGFALQALAGPGSAAGITFPNLKKSTKPAGG